MDKKNLNVNIVNFKKVDKSRGGSDKVDKVFCCSILASFDAIFGHFNTYLAIIKKKKKNKKLYNKILFKYF